MFIFTVIVIMFIIAVVLIWIYANTDNNSYNYDENNKNEGFKPLNISEVKPRSFNNSTSINSYSTDVPYSILDSYAFANRLKNIIFARGINEDVLTSSLDISDEMLRKYKYSKGLPPQYIIQKFEDYFNVSFKYLADCKGNTITVFNDGRFSYSQTYNYPHKAQFDLMGNCIFLDKTSSNNEILYHLDIGGNIIGFIDDFPKGAMQYVKIKDNGLHALIVSENQSIFFIDLNSHSILWKKTLKMNWYNIKDITDTELIFRVVLGEPSIDFSLDYSGEPCNIDRLAHYYLNKKPPVNHYWEDYLFLISVLLKDIAKNENIIIEYIKYMTKSTRMKYFSKKKIANIHKLMGKYYFDIGNYEIAYKFFKKAIHYNPKITVKSYMNKLEKLRK